MAYHVIEQRTRQRQKTKTCRQSEGIDYVVYYGADFGEKFLESVSKAEAEKPYNQRDHVALFLLALGKLGFGLIKIGVNQDLCEPIGRTNQGR